MLFVYGYVYPASNLAPDDQRQGGPTSTRFGQRWRYPAHVVVTDDLELRAMDRNPVPERIGPLRHGAGPSRHAHAARHDKMP
jgi:hypothetical protein